MADLLGQGDYGVRLDWGPVGARAVAADVAVVVDVLSFSTTVTVAVERGTRVIPCRWNDARAAQIARDHDAVLAVGRLEATTGDGAHLPSLSPAGLLAGEPVARLVLPSPNGSTIAATLSERGSAVAVGCLRNASAVAAWLVPALEAGRSVAIIAAGERWSADDSLRPALEDHLGAGAILSALGTLGHLDRMSPEALAAAETFDAGRHRLAERLRDCVGGRELRTAGFASDVPVAADLDASSVVPVLVEGVFERAPATGDRPRRPDVTDTELVGGVEKRELVLVEHDPSWPTRYAEHEARIRGALGDVAVEIVHIGSTSVPGLAAKPIIDILVTVTDITAEEDYLDPLVGAGYVVRVREPGHRLVRTDGRDVHVHLYEPDHPAVADYVLLRDRLRSHDGDRELYESTKRALTARDWPDMNAYADAKTDVIEAIKRRARAAGSDPAPDPSQQRR